MTDYDQRTVFFNVTGDVADTMSDILKICTGPPTFCLFSVTS